MLLAFLAGAVIGFFVGAIGRELNDFGGRQ